jgi:hypothetical protein
VQALPVANARLELNAAQVRQPELIRFPNDPELPQPVDYRRRVREDWRREAILQCATKGKFRPPFCSCM